MQLIKSRMVSEHWLSAIINCDYSGLDDKEVMQLDEWLQENPAGTYYVSDDFDGTSFTRDAISGLASTCVQLDMYE